MRYLLMFIVLWLPTLMAGGDEKESVVTKKQLKSSLKKPGAGASTAKKQVVIKEEANVTKEFESHPEDLKERSEECMRIQSITTGKTPVEVSADEEEYLIKVEGKKSPYEATLSDMVDKAIEHARELKSVEPLERLSGVLRNALAIPSFEDKYTIINTYRNRIANEIDVLKKEFGFTLHAD